MPRGVCRKKQTVSNGPRRHQGNALGTHRELGWNASSRGGKLWERVGSVRYRGDVAVAEARRGDTWRDLWVPLRLCCGGGRFLEDISAVKSMEGEFGRGKETGG